MNHSDVNHGIDPLVFDRAAAKVLDQYVVELREGRGSMSLLELIELGMLAGISLTQSDVENVSEDVSPATDRGAWDPEQIDGEEY